MWMGMPWCKGFNFREISVDLVKNDSGRETEKFGGKSMTSMGNTFYVD